MGDNVAVALGREAEAAAVAPGGVADTAAAGVAVLCAPSLPLHAAANPTTIVEPITQPRDRVSIS